MRRVRMQNPVYSGPTSGDVDSKTHGFLSRSTECHLNSIWLV